MGLCRLTYISQTDIFYSANRTIITNAILLNARRNNYDLNITGTLLCGSGYFYQVLEGKFCDLLYVMKKIRKDDRHYNIRTLQFQSLAKRQFDQWSMGEVDLSFSSRSLMGFFLRQAHQGDEKHADVLYKLARTWSHNDQTGYDDSHFNWYGSSQKSGFLG